MDAPLVARYPASAAIRGLCGAFPTVTLQIDASHAVIVIPEDAPVPPAGCIVDLEVQLDTGRVHAIAFVEARHVVEDDAGDEAFAVDLGFAELDPRGARAIADARRIEARLAAGGEAAAAEELAQLRSDHARERGQHDVAAALAPPPPPPHEAPKRVGYWASWAEEEPRRGMRGMRVSRGDTPDEGRKRPKPARHHWEVPDRFRPKG